MKRIPSIVLLAAALTFTVGCNYYEVTDPQTERTYFTHSWQHKYFKDNGAIQFKDEITGRTVTLQSHEVKKISGKEFNRTVKASRED